MAAAHQVGEYLRRSEGIAALGTDAQGRLQLDIPAIRQRISTVGSLYTPPGPHHSVTPQPGLSEAAFAALWQMVRQPDNLHSATLAVLGGFEGEGWVVCVQLLSAPASKDE